MRSEHKELSEPLKKKEHKLPERDVRNRKSLMELLTLRELIEATKMRVSSGSERLTFPDASDTLGDPVVKSTIAQLIKQLLESWTN